MDLQIQILAGGGLFILLSPLPHPKTCTPRSKLLGVRTMKAMEAFLPHSPIVYLCILWLNLATVSKVIQIILSH